MSSTTWKKVILGSIFVILSFFYTFLLMNHGNSNWNLLFDVERIKSLGNILVSPTNFDYWGSSGSPVNLFMPWLTLLPTWALFQLGGGTFNYLVIFFIINLITFISAYYFSQKLFDNTLQSFLFSVIYTLSSIRASLVFDNQISSYLLLSMLPIVFCGLFKLITGEFKYWPVFTVGIILVIFTKPWMAIGLSAISVSLILLSIFSRKTHSWKHWGMIILTLFESSLLILISTLGFTLPLVEQMLGQNDFYQDKIDSAYVRIGNFDLTNYYSSDQNKYLIISAVFIILAVIILFFIKSNLIIKLSIFGVIISGLLSTDLVSWSKFEVVDLTRLSYCFGIICIYLLLQVVSYLLTEIVRNKSSIAKLFLLLMVIILSCVPLYFTANGMKGGSLNVNSSSSNQVLVHAPQRVRQTKSDLNKFVVGGEKRELRTQTTPDTFEFKFYSPKSTVIDTPVWAYKGRHAQINNETVPTTMSARGTIKIHTQPGANIVKIEYQYTTLAKISLLISGLGILILCWLVLNKGRWTIRKIVYNS